jgi:hypothetical protein
MAFLSHTSSMSLRCLLVALALACTSARADEVLTLRDGEQTYALNPYLGVLEDPAGTLILKDVASPTPGAAFTYPHADITNFGFSSQCSGRASM